MIQNLVTLPIAVRHVTPTPGGISEIPVEKVVPNPRQPRTHFDDADMSSLVESIRAVGVVQPIIVRPAANGAYELVAGERRWRAAIEADLRTIPAIVKEMNQTESLEIALIENIQRAGLSSIETALAYKSLLEEHGLTHEEVAKRVGKDRTTITNTLRLLKLPIDIQDLLVSGKLSEGHARVILTLNNVDAQMALALEIVEKGLSVRETEAKVMGKSEKAGHSQKVSRSRKSEWRSIEDQMTRRWGRQVRIMGTKNGRVEISFHGVDDLNRLVRELLD